MSVLIWIKQFDTLTPEHFLSEKKLKAIFLIRIFWVFKRNLNVKTDGYRGYLLF